MDILGKLRRKLIPSREEATEDAKADMERLKAELEKEKIKSELREVKGKGKGSGWNPDPKHLDRIVGFE